MPSLPLYNMEKKKVGNVELNDKIFSADVKPHLIHDAVRAQIAWKYELKTANARTRTEVHGTRKKMYKQKGTGQARHGDAKAPIFVGGGKAFGPRPRVVTHKINKKAMRGALISALSMSQKSDRLFIVDKMASNKPSAKQIAKMLVAFGGDKLLVINAGDEEGEKLFNLGVRNVKGAKILKPEGVNVFDILKYRTLVMSQKAAQKLTERLTHV